MAADYRGLWFWHKKGRSLTPKQEAVEIRTVLDALEVAHDKLNSSRVGFIGYEGGNVREAMTAFIAKTKRHLNKLNAVPTRAAAAKRSFESILASLLGAGTPGGDAKGEPKRLSTSNDQEPHRELSKQNHLTTSEILAR